jgi:ankyrin repeat protein
VNAKDTYGWTPLRWAAYKGYLEVAKVLLAHSADVNAKDKDGKTPLDLADYNTREAIKQYLKNQQKNNRYAPIESLIVNLPEN